MFAWVAKALRIYCYRHQRVMVRILGDPYCTACNYQERIRLLQQRQALYELYRALAEEPEVPWGVIELDPEQILPSIY